MFPTELACAAYIEAIRWPSGFSCPACGNNGNPQRIATRPRIIRCRHCLSDVALTAVKLGPSDRERIASLATIKKRTPHYLMKEAILEYVQREEARQNFIGAAETSFEHFKETGSIKEKTTTSKGVGKS